MTFRVSKLYEHASIPRRGYNGDAGYDVSAREDVTIEPHSWKLVPTGIAIQVPQDCYVRVAPRSGLSCRGVMVGAGVVDSNYRGEIKVLLFNMNKDTLNIKLGDRVAQLIFERIYTPVLEEVSYEELTASERGEGGFGSTGQ